ncbi:MAG: hypothetical protein GX537_10760 [Actinobacteria bacterium]|nr:hypothetical protein [Actinomycetota bacterium]
MLLLTSVILTLLVLVSAATAKQATKNKPVLYAKLTATGDCLRPFTLLGYLDGNKMNLPTVSPKAEVYRVANPVKRAFRYVGKLTPGSRSAGKYAKAHLVDKHVELWDGGSHMYWLAGVGETSDPMVDNATGMELYGKEYRLPVAARAASPSPVIAYRLRSGPSPDARPPLPRRDPRRPHLARAHPDGLRASAGHRDKTVVRCERGGGAVLQSATADRFMRFLAARPELAAPLERDEGDCAHSQDEVRTPLSSRFTRRYGWMTPSLLSGCRRRPACIAGPGGRLRSPVPRYRSGREQEARAYAR